MNNAFRDVPAFHAKFRPEQIGDTPKRPDLAVLELRIRLLREEFDETIDAMLNDDIPGVADGLADLIYVAVGAAISYGIDLRPIWDAVHESNMAKTGGPTREDRKVMKPPGWSPPDVAGILARQLPVAEDRR